MSQPELCFNYDTSPCDRVNLHTIDVSPRNRLDYYLYIREIADKSHIATDEQLKEIHKKTEEWIEASGFSSQIPEYGIYSKDALRTKMLGLCNFMAANFPQLIHPSIIDATNAFVESSYAMYEEFMDIEEGLKHDDSDGSFAFIVPMRVSRFREDYGQEVEKISPILRYVPNKYRAMFAIGLPPLVLDQYEKDENGNRGYLVLAPVYGDMMVDLEFSEADRVANKNINDAVNFANKRLGADIVGLGAVLPAITRYGNTIDNKHVITTTGHGGTTHLILATVEEALNRGFVDENLNSSIGVLGLGSIGASIAHLVGDRFPDAQLRVFDTNENKIKRTLDDLGKIGILASASKSESELLKDSGVIISAIVGQVDLAKHDLDSLAGRFIIDDSQPGCFSREQVEALGGFMTWVIGTASNIRRNGYDYGTLANSQTDIFGCEGEAAALAMYSQELAKRGFDDKTRTRILKKIALAGPVTPAKAKLIGALFKKYGIKPAEFQVFGKHI